MNTIFIIVLVMIILGCLIRAGMIIGDWIYGKITNK